MSPSRFLQGAYRSAPARTLLAGLVCASILLTLSGPARAGDDAALIAVAANFAEVAEALETDFEAGSDHRITLTTGSTGKLFAQIAHGAPYAALLSADAATPERLETEGRAVPGTRFTYAIGRLALWSTDPGRIGPDGRAALMSPDLRHLAIANPRLAPYGEAARQTLEKLGLWESLRPRVVMGENIGQAQTFVATGAADLGLVAWATVLGLPPRRRGSHWLVPEDWHLPIRQDAVLLAAGRDSPAAAAFLDYLRTPLARDRISAAGYRTD